MRYQLIVMINSFIIANGHLAVHTVSFLFKLSSLKKLVKWSGYEI